jgi:hypothetical protein
MAKLKSGLVDQVLCFGLFFWLEYLIIDRWRFIWVK